MAVTIPAARYTSSAFAALENETAAGNQVGDVWHARILTQLVAVKARRPRQCFVVQRRQRAAAALRRVHSFNSISHTTVVSERCLPRPRSRMPNGQAPLHGPPGAVRVRLDDFADGAGVGVGCFGVDGDDHLWPQRLDESGQVRWRGMP